MARKRLVQTLQPGRLLGDLHVRNELQLVRARLAREHGRVVERGEGGHGSVAVAVGLDEHLEQLQAQEPMSKRASLGDRRTCSALVPLVAALRMMESR